jgi:hypothetical protein
VPGGGAWLFESRCVRPVWPPTDEPSSPPRLVQPARAVVGGLPRLGELRYLELAGLARLHGVPEQLEVITHHGHLLLHVLLRLGRLLGEGVRERVLQTAKDERARIRVGRDHHTRRLGGVSGSA